MVWYNVPSISHSRPYRKDRHMPSPKKPCPLCGQPMSARSQMCRACRDRHPYERTPEHREHLSERLSGKPKPWLRGRKRPEHSRKMKEWWTPERRQEKRQEMLGRNPGARYHGLSAKSAARLVARIGRCECCGHDGSESRLDIHHRNRNKRDQRLENLEVLCHRCHMQEHASRGETGFDSMWRKRRSNQD